MRSIHSSSFNLWLIAPVSPKHPPEQTILTWSKNFSITITLSYVIQTLENSNKYLISASN
jgi:hypothetical protein